MDGTQQLEAFQAAGFQRQVLQAGLYDQPFPGLPEGPQLTESDTKLVQRFLQVRGSAFPAMPYLHMAVRERWFEACIL